MALILASSPPRFLQHSTLHTIHGSSFITCRRWGLERNLRKKSIVEQDVCACARACVRHMSHGNGTSVCVPAAFCSGRVHVGRGRYGSRLAEQARRLAVRYYQRIPGVLSNASSFFLVRRVRPSLLTSPILRAPC